jgi:hypothetical protein
VFALQEAPRRSDIPKVVGTRGGQRSCTRLPARAAARARRPRSEAGVSLVEVLCAVILLGAVMTTMMSAILATTVTSDQVRASALADAELHRYADYVRTKGYESCADPPTYAYPYRTTQDGAPDASVSGRVVSIDYWPKADAAAFMRNGSINFVTGWAEDATEEAAGSPCKDQVPQDVDGGLQRITLEITVSAGRVETKQITIIKRKDTK